MHRSLTIRLREALGILISVLLLSACSISLITERGDNKMISFCWKYYQATKYGTPMPETLHAYSNEAKDIRNSDFNNLTCTPQNKLEFLKCYIDICDKLGFNTTKISLVKEYNSIADKTGAQRYKAISAPINATPDNLQKNTTKANTSANNRSTSVRTNTGKTQKNTSGSINNTKAAASPGETETDTDKINKVLDSWYD